RRSSSSSSPSRSPGGGGEQTTNVIESPSAAVLHAGAAKAGRALPRRGRSTCRGADGEDADVPRLREPSEAPIPRRERAALPLCEGQIDAIRELVAEVEG